MKTIASNELLQVKTFITKFMLDNTLHEKTFAELVDIFEDSWKKMNIDPSEDKRILKFSKEMENGNWNGNISITIDKGLAKDGIHRGIAYLRCINKGFTATELPIVILDEIQL